MAVTSRPAESTGSLTRFRSEWVRDRAKKIGFARVEDLATAADISRQQLQNLLANKNLPSTPTAKRLAAALMCKSDELTEDVPAGEAKS